MRGEEETGETLDEQIFLAPQSETGEVLEVRLRLLADKEDPARALLVAEVSAPQRWPDFSGIGVVLYLPDGLPQRQITGRAGIARYADTRFPRRGCYP